MAAVAVATAAQDAECERVWGVSLEEEWKLVAQLRDEAELEAGPLAPEWDDYVLRRFLRARKHNILKAKIMFLDSLKWRKETEVDTVLTDFQFTEKQQFNKYYPEAFYGTDREGRPIYVQQPGKIDTDALWKFTTMDRSIRYHLQCQERYWRIIAPCASIAAGRKHEASLVVIDMDGVGISTLTGEVRKIMSIIMQIDQDYYPELMWKAVIINAPTTFRVIWGMIKYLMDARTQEKIEVLGVDYQSELLRLIPAENLMQCYGGTNPLPLSAAPGPWQDAAVIAQLEQQQRDIVASGKQPTMTFPQGAVAGAPPLDLSPPAAEAAAAEVAEDGTAPS